MRFSISAILAVATSFALVHAQDLSGIPTCALPCFAAAVGGSGCSLTDTKCQCTTGRDSITNSILQCAPSKCSGSEIASLAPAVQSLCAQAGVTITNVPSVVPSATSGASKATSAMSGTASMSHSMSATASAPPAATTNAGVSKVAGMGVVVMGFAVGVLAL